MLAAWNFDVNKFLGRLFDQYPLASILTYLAGAVLVWMAYDLLKAYISTRGKRG